MNQLSTERYARQVALPELGEAGQQALADAKVVVVGAGGLGTPVLLYLAGAGVGHIHILDDDEVSLTNLHRQVIHDESRLGLPKAASAAKRLAELNSEITITHETTRLTSQNAAEQFSGANLVLDCTDNFAARYHISGGCAQLGIPHVWGAISGSQAQVCVFTDAFRYEDLHPTPPPDGTVPTCVEIGALGPVVGMAGAMMATEAIRLLIGHSPSTDLASYDLATGWEYVPLRRSHPIP